MGIIRAAAGSLDGMYQDAWREFFYFPALEGDTLMVRVRKTVSENSGNNGNDDVIDLKVLPKSLEGVSHLQVMLRRLRRGSMS